MTTALFAPADSLAPGLAGALAALGRDVTELPWGGDLRAGVDVAGSDVLVTVAPRPQLGPLVGARAGGLDRCDPRHRRAAGRRGACAAPGRRGKRWVAVIPHLSSLPSPGIGPVRRRRRPAPDGAARGSDRERSVGVLRQRRRRRTAGGPLDRDGERILREDTPRAQPTTLEELAELVHWLGGAAPASLNGDTLKLDGGFSLTRKTRPAPSAEVAEWLGRAGVADLGTAWRRARSSTRRWWLSRA